MLPPDHLLMGRRVIMDGQLMFMCVSSMEYQSIRWISILTQSTVPILSWSLVCLNTRFYVVLILDCAVSTWSRLLDYLLHQFTNCVVKVLWVKFSNMFDLIRRIFFGRWRSLLQEWTRLLFMFGCFDILVGCLMILQFFYLGYCNRNLYSVILKVP